MSHRFYGVMVSTLDFESKDPSSSLGRTSFVESAWNLQNLILQYNFKIEEINWVG